MFQYCVPNTRRRRGRPGRSKLHTVTISPARRIRVQYRYLIHDGKGREGRSSPPVRPVHANFTAVALQGSGKLVIDRLLLVSSTERALIFLYSESICLFLPSVTRLQGRPTKRRSCLYETHVRTVQIRGRYRLRQVVLSAFPFAATSQIVNDFSGWTALLFKVTVFNAAKWSLTVSSWNR